MQLEMLLNYLIYQRLLDLSETMTVNQKIQKKANKTEFDKQQ